MNPVEAALLFCMDEHDLPPACALVFAFTMLRGEATYEELTKDMLDFNREHGHPTRESVLLWAREGLNMCLAVVGGDEKTLCGKRVVRGRFHCREHLPERN